MDARPITVPANGLLFEALEWGPPEGRTVLLLHGFPQRSTSWAQVGPRLADLGLHAVAVDQRGYSPAARPVEVAAYALPQLVADVIGVVQWLGGAADLVGHDWGAVVGWQVASRCPELVRSWTALSTPSPLALAAVLASSDEQREQFGYIRMLREPDAEQRLLADDAAGLRSFYQSRVVGEDDHVAFFAEPGVLTAALNWYRAMARTDNDGLAPVTVPTSYVWGSADLAFGRVAAESTVAYVDAPYAFVPLEGASHWLPDEAPDAVAEAIAERVLG